MRTETKVAKKAIIEVLSVSEVKTFEYEIDEKENGQIVKDTKGNAKKKKVEARFHSLKFINFTTGEIEDITVKPDDLERLSIMAGKRYTMYYDRIEKVETKNKFNHALPFTGKVEAPQVEDIPFEAER